MKTRFFLASALSGLALSGSAWAITVDGNLDDWGVNHSTWVPTTGIHSTIEDQTGSGSYYLNPGWGGQAYDAEALYATIIGQKLYIALATGHDPRTLQNPAGNSYGAGDFAIDFGKDGTYEVGINIVHAGTGSNTDPIQTQGGVYRVTQWNYGLWNTAGNYIHDGIAATSDIADALHPTYIQSGSLLGQATLAINYGPTGTGTTNYGAVLSDTHFFYEMSVDLQTLRDAGWTGNAFNIQWTENCANDSIIVDPPAPLPEPGSLALLGIGLAGLAGMRRRRA